MPDNNDYQNILRRGKIYIVGSGSLDRFPKVGCQCRLCQIARKGGKDKRIPASSIFYKDILFDLGPGVWGRVMKRRLKPKAVVLSHVHYDHIADLIEYPKISRQLPIYASSLYESLFGRLGIRARYFKPNGAFRIPLATKKKLMIVARIGIHTFTRPVSILKFDGIIYAPDLGDVKAMDIFFAKGTKLWFGDGFNLYQDFVIQGEKLHMSVKKLLTKLKKLKSLEKVLLLGIGHHSEYPHEDYELLVQKVASEESFPFKVELGFDNLIINSPY